MSCSVCQLPITDTLDRECPFCSTIFSRVDGARRHAKRCPRRGDRTLHPGKRGRKALSCDRCSRLKVHCTAQSQTPCHACALREVPCTFTRCCTDASHRLLEKTLPSPRHQSSGTSQTVHSHDSRVPLSFLLNSTDDTQDYITERSVGTEPDSALVGPICVTPERDSILDYIDPTLLLPFDGQGDLEPFQLGELYTAEDDTLIGSFPPFPTHRDKLAARIELLEAHVHTHVRSREQRGLSFDKFAFRRFFDVSNVHTFATTFCRKRHYRYPVIHWPTFALEEAPLPLLMVVALTGASYSYRSGYETEHISNARGLYRLADSYVFEQLSIYTDGSEPNIDIAEAIQLCQAALLMYGLDTLLASDPEMQHRAITQRLPALVSAIRKLDFVSCRHTISEDWQLFIHREHIIRLVSWTFCADCLATLSFNRPPLFSMLEMTGDLPCDPTLWDSDLTETFKQPHQQPSHSLKDLMSSFLNAERPENLPLFHLHIVLCGFQQIIFNMHITMVLPAHSSKLLQILDTWQSLWETAMEAMPNSHLGVARYVPGIEYLSRRIIEVAVSPTAASSRYLQRIPSYGTREIHEFIRDFVAKA